MVDWLTWPADLLLSVGGIVASWFVSKDTPSFVPSDGVCIGGLGGYRIDDCVFTTVARILAVAFSSFLALTYL
jgi:hypothetical protein